MDSASWMEKAISLALENVREGRSGPFAALVVKDGRMVGSGTNLVTATNDPTAHAELVRGRTAKVSTILYDHVLLPHLQRAMFQHILFREALCFELAGLAVGCCPGKKVIGTWECGFGNKGALCIGFSGRTDGAACG